MSDSRFRSCRVHITIASRRERPAPGVHRTQWEGIPMRNRWRWMLAGVFGVAMMAAPQLASAQDRCERGYRSAYRSYGYGYERGYAYRAPYARGSWGRSRAYEYRNGYARNGAYGGGYGNNYGYDGGSNYGYNGGNNYGYNGGNTNNYNPHPNGIATGPT